MSDIDELIARLEHTTGEALPRESAAALREQQRRIAELERDVTYLASYDELKDALVRAEKAEAERDALKLRVNSLIGLCKSYSGALLDSDYPPTERDKLDALIGDIEKPPSAKENADG